MQTTSHIYIKHLNEYLFYRFSFFHIFLVYWIKNVWYLVFLNCCEIKLTVSSISSSCCEWHKSKIRAYNSEGNAGNKLPCNSLHDFLHTFAIDVNFTLYWFCLVLTVLSKVPALCNYYLPVGNGLPMSMENFNTYVTVSADLHLDVGSAVCWLVLMAQDS